MAKRKKNKYVNLPEIDGKPKPGQYYYAVNSIKSNGSLVTKLEMKEIYNSRFSKDPAVIFYGPPNGSLIMAGPIGGE